MKYQVEYNKKKDELELVTLQEDREIKRERYSVLKHIHLNNEGFEVPGVVRSY